MANRPEITGKWQRADNTNHAVEVAETERGDVFALRDTYDQGQVIFATDNQLRNLADSLQKGPLRNLIDR
jgi:hypothetical protein